MARGAVLRIRDFRLLFASSTISVVGNAFTNVALAFGVLDATHSTRDIGIVIALRLVGQVALMLVGGTWGDRVSRRTLLIVTAVLSGMTQSGVAALFLTHTAALWSLSVLALGNGAASAFSVPAATGILPQIVPEHLLSSANALSSIMRNSANIAGAATAGALVAVASPGWALAIDAATFFASAALVSRMSALPPSGVRSGMIAELREGWQEFVARTWVWVIVVQFTVFNMAAAAVIAVYAPVIAQLDLGGPAAYGAMTAALGAGGIVGGVVMLRFRPSRPLIAGTIAIAIVFPFVGALAAGASLWFVMVMAAAAGCGVEVFDVLWASAIQRHIPADRLSRVAAYDSMGSVAFTPVGMLLAGAAVEWLGGVHHAVWAALVVMAVPTFAVLVVPSVRKLTDSAGEEMTAG